MKIEEVLQDGDDVVISFSCKKETEDLEKDVELIFCNLDVEDSNLINIDDDATKLDQISTIKDRFQSLKVKSAYQYENTVYVISELPVMTGQILEDIIDGFADESSRIERII